MSEIKALQSSTEQYCEMDDENEIETNENHKGFLSVVWVELNQIGSNQYAYARIHETKVNLIWEEEEENTKEIRVFLY